MFSLILLVIKSMTPYKMPKLLTALPILFFLMVLGLVGHTNEESQQEGPNIVSEETLGGAKRFLTHTSTDKPIYRIGETVYVRTVLLNAHDQTPYLDKNAGLTMKILGPTGDELLKQGALGENSTFGLSWKIPEGTAGGVHKVVLESSMGLAPKAERHFEIRTYRPRLHDIDITFAKKGYGVGDTVSADIDIKRANGSIPSGAKLSAIARLDGQEVHREEFIYPTEGQIKVHFELPKRISRGEGTLFISLLDGGTDSSHGKSLPILLQTVDISFFPEGGELIEGLKSKVYFQAWRPDGQPADLKGALFDASGQATGIEVSTTHEGRGHFSFTPGSRQLFLKISEPSGIRPTYALPRPRAVGASLHVSKAIENSGRHLNLQVGAKGVELGWLTLCQREKVLDRVDLRTQSLGNHIKLNPGESSGTLIATLWDAGGLPLAERLVFIHPKENVDLKVSVITKNPSPGDEVEVEITALNAQGEPIEAVVGLTVTDLRTQEMIENREQAPRLPEMVFLENEVHDLNDTQAYLRGKTEETNQNLDLLLGVQGWRRFLLARDWNVDPKPEEKAQAAMAKVDPRLAYRRGMMKGRNGGIAMMALKNRNGMVVADMIFEEEDFEQVQFFGGAAQVEVEELMAMAPMEDAQLGRGEIKVKRQLIPIKAEAFNLKQEQKKLKKRAGAREMNMDMIREIPRKWQLLREYAHTRQKPIIKGDRRDFTETLYWSAGKKTDSKTGKIQLKFQLSDSLTRYQVQADAFTSKGILGSKDGHIDVNAPFHLEPKWPLHLSEGDRVLLPVGIIGTLETGVELNLSCSTLNLDENLSLAKGTFRGHLSFEASHSGNHTFTLWGKAGELEDRITHSIVITPKGFPIQLQSGGMLKAGQDGELKMTLPPTLQPGSLGSLIRVYPTPQASLDGALGSLLRQPHGCFEQTSSTNYPLVMAQQYFLSHQGVDPEMISKGRELLKKGYQRLIGFECKEGGYEWFGRGPGHEGLTAYGLMQFTDMARFMDVDQSMITRTRSWLLNRRDGKGSFKKSSKHLDSFGGATSELTDAYLVWALLESGEAPGVLQKEIEQLIVSNANQTDPYIQALMANLLDLAGKKHEARTFLKKLADAQSKDGKNEGAVTSITSSRGSSLTVETTALSILAWLKGGEKWMAPERKALDWLHTQGKSGRYGNTQATILALKAIVAHDKAFARPAQAGKVWLSMGGIQISEPLPFTSDTKDTLELPDISAALKPGASQKITLHMEGGSPMPFTLEVNYHSPLPPSVSNPALIFTSTLAHNELTEGEPTNLNLRVEAQEDTPTPILILGIPGGLELRHDQLKSWVQEGKIASYETKEGTLALYWRGLKEGQVVQLPLDLTANLPGTYQSISSLAYPYYEEENVHWIDGTQITILPRQ
jgi:alpha-2-macroglobulin-like protein